MTFTRSLSTITGTSTRWICGIALTLIALTATAQDRASSPSAATKQREAAPSQAASAGAPASDAKSTAAGSTAADSTAAAATPLQAMLVTGGCCHDYDAQKLIITEGLAQRLGPIQWTIHHYPEAKDTRAVVYENPDWAKGFDLVVHNECFGAMNDGDLVKRIIEGHHKFKVPAVFVHCSMHSYRNSSAAESWREFIGVTSTFHEKAKRPLTVVPTESGKQSTLLDSLADSWQTPNGELYVVTKVWPGTQVLATAFSTEQDSDQPVIWLREQSGVRVFGTTLGHHNETVRSEPWQAMFAAGTRWALRRE